MEEYLALAKKYYSTEVLYEDTIEYKRLTDRVIYECDNGTQEPVLFRVLSDAFGASKYEINIMTQFSMLDRSHIFRIENLEMKSKEHIFDTIVCCSFLGPYFCIYQQETAKAYYSNGDRAGQFIKVNTKDRSYIDPAKLTILRQSLLNMGYTEVTEKDLTLRMPGFQICGIPPNKFTVFNTLFRDTMEI